MPTCTLRRTTKIDGTRYAPGATVNLSEAVYAQLVTAGVVEGASVPPTAAVTVRIPRTAQEKQAALTEAQARIIKATGTATGAPG